MSRRFAGLTGIKGLSDIFLDTRLFRTGMAERVGFEPTSGVENAQLIDFS